MTAASGGPKGDGRNGVALHAVVLLLGGLAGAALLTALQAPAGALLGSVLGSMTANRLSQAVRDRRSRGPEERKRVKLPGAVRIVGQVLLGVLAGTQLTGETLTILLRSLPGVIGAVVVMLALSVVLARYLFSRHGVDGLTAVMAAAPGGISELASSADRQGAAMHVVLAIHLFRVLVVVLVVLPLVLLVLRAA